MEVLENFFITHVPWYTLSKRILDREKTKIL
jgi:hypothetical protein